MAKARVCDVCGNVILGKRNIITVRELEADADPRYTKIIGNYDMHPECIKEFFDWIKDNKKGVQQ